MIVQVRLFAMLRERAGTDRVPVELPAGATAADALRGAAAAAGFDDLVAGMPVALAVNREYAPADRLLDDGDEVAAIPPVSGGSGEPVVHARIVDGPISADRVMDRVRSPRAGAIVTFHGVTRDVARLEYDAYAEMAGTLLERILAEVAAGHGLLAIAAEHRTGAVALGEASIVIAASAAHRPEAFAGARAAIDRVKAELPVWKREVADAAADDGGGWVEGTPVDVHR